jgi:hypothetical protein
MLAVAGAFDHLLENGPAIVAGGRTQFDELGNNLVPFCAAPRSQLTALIGN